jgi:hypothetical protein
MCPGAPLVPINHAAGRQEIAVEIRERIGQAVAAWVTLSEWIS